jgi:L-rhamnose mutarotase
MVAHRGMELVTPGPVGVRVKRICFVLQVRPEKLQEYKERHQRVWPEMLDALSRTGWRHYSLFLRDDGLLIGYLETPDFCAALDGMAALDVNRRWQAEMQPFFQAVSDRPDENMSPLEEVFHLD